MEIVVITVKLISKPREMVISEITSMNSVHFHPRISNALDLLNATKDFRHIPLDNRRIF